MNGAGAFRAFTYDPEPFSDPAVAADAEMVRLRMLNTRFTAARFLPPILPIDLENGVADRLAACLDDVATDMVALWLAMPFGTRVADRYAEHLLARFARATTVETRWGLGEAFERAASARRSDLTDDVVALLTNRDYGRGREMLALALPKLGAKNGRIAALKLIGSDPEIDGFLLTGLGKFGAGVDAALLERFAEDDRTWLRRRAAALLRAQRGAGPGAP
ncbi:MAG: hypothetical protein PGN13_07455 [Patulibacter minatonensis]